MTKKDRTMQVQLQEDVPANGIERTRSRRCLVPKTDIYETEKEIVLLADIPGANEKTTDITLEKNVLTINAFIDPVPSSDYDLAYAEYEEGNYQRVFHLSDDIQRDKIEATVSDGVLRLHLPKSESALAKKITVQTK
jgi:HSP20 family molecular chaperone IbpA